MPDSRHKGPYRNGEKLQGTRAWALKLDALLARNRAAGTNPGSRAALARVIGADKTGLNRFLDGLLAGETLSSKYVADICAVLRFDVPLVENPDDELEKKIARLTEADDRKLVDDLVERLLQKKR